MPCAEGKVCQPQSSAHNPQDLCGGRNCWASTISQPKVYNTWNVTIQDSNLVSCCGTSIDDGQVSGLLLPGQRKRERDRERERSMYDCFPNFIVQHATTQGKTGLSSVSEQLYHVLQKNKTKKKKEKKITLIVVICISLKQLLLSSTKTARQREDEERNAKEDILSYPTVLQCRLLCEVAGLWQQSR